MKAAYGRVLTFGLLVLPALAWVAVATYAADGLARWEPHAGEMPLTLRLALATFNNGFRFLPFAFLIATVLSPLLTLAIGRVSSSLTPRSGARSDVLAWWAVAVVLGAVALRLVSIRDLPDIYLISHRAPVLFMLSWAAYVALALSLASAYAVQSELFARGQSKLKPLWVLIIAAPFYCLAGFPTLCIPPIYWGVDRFRQARAEAKAGKDPA